MIFCPICSDAFIASNNVVNIPCGHVFHYECVVQWFNRSKTCPQCRKPATDKQLVRLYLNVVEDSLDHDPATLFATIDGLKMKIHSVEENYQLMESTMKIIKKEKEELHSNLDVLREENKNVINNNVALVTENNSLRKHAETLKSLEQNIKHLNQEKQKLEIELIALKSTSNIIHGSVSEADAALLELSDGSNSSKNLVAVCGALKRDLSNKDNKLCASQKEIERYKMLLDSETRKKLKTLEEIKLKPFKIEERKLKKENVILKQKVGKMQASIMSPTPGNTKDKLLNRHLNVSPMPNKKLNCSLPISPDVMILSPPPNKTFTTTASKLPALESKAKQSVHKKVETQTKSKIYKTTSVCEPRGFKSSLGSKSSSVSGGAMAKLKTSVQKSASSPGSTSVVSFCTSQMKKADVRKRLHGASQTPPSMAHTSVRGSVRADPTIKLKKSWVP